MPKEKCCMCDEDALEECQVDCGGVSCSMPLCGEAECYEAHMNLEHEKKVK